MKHGLRALGVLLVVVLAGCTDATPIPTAADMPDEPEAPPNTTTPLGDPINPDPPQPPQDPPETPDPPSPPDPPDESAELWGAMASNAGWLSQVKVFWVINRSDRTSAFEEVRQQCHDGVENAAACSMYTWSSQDEGRCLAYAVAGWWSNWDNKFNVSHAFYASAETAATAEQLALTEAENYKREFFDPEDLARVLGSRCNNY